MREECGLPARKRKGSGQDGRAPSEEKAAAGMAAFPGGRLADRDT